MATTSRDTGSTDPICATKRHFSHRAGANCRLLAQNVGDVKHRPETQLLVRRRRGGGRGWIAQVGSQLRGVSSAVLGDDPPAAEGEQDRYRGEGHVYRHELPVPILVKDVFDPGSPYENGPKRERTEQVGLALSHIRNVA